MFYVRGGTATGSYAYDKNGNMINDRRRALNLSYNVLNLLREVKTTSGELKARYNYLADGTKLRVRDASGNGFDYLGSLTYKSSSVGLQLESASFGDGVLRASEVNYFLTDHLGSVRVIVDGSGSVKERNDYYPFGARHVKSDYPQRDDNRYKYNGKEEQVTGDVDYLDYGARMYDSGLGRWFSIDPRLERYVNVSPYVYCANNPIILVDVNGEYIADDQLDEWNGLTGNVNNKRREVLWLMNYTSGMLNRYGFDDPMYDVLRLVFTRLQTELSVLNSILMNFRLIEMSDQLYRLVKSNDGVGFVTYSPKTGAIEIKYLSVANFVHESTHVAQYEKGDIAFYQNGGNTFLQDIYDEVEAYRAQYIYERQSLNGINPAGIPKELGNLSSAWVQGIIDSNGSKPYAPGGWANTGIYPLNERSSRDDFIKAFPHISPVVITHEFLIKQFNNVLYKNKMKLK